MTNPKGTQLETAVVRYLNERGWPFARRLAKEGAKDKGDVTLGDGFPVTIEAKNRKGFELAQTQRELKAEMEHAGVPWGFAVHKKRGTTKVGEYYAVLPVDIMMDILELAILNRQKAPLPRAQETPRRKRVIPRYEPD